MMDDASPWLTCDLLCAEAKERREREMKEKAKLNKEKRLMEARGVWRDEIIPQWEKLYSSLDGLIPSFGSFFLLIPILKKRDTADIRFSVARRSTGRAWSGMDG